MTAVVKLIDFNYALQDSVSVTATSEDSNFPASNIQNPFRSKPWRSSGYYVITTSNNKINFKESGGGAELTATLVAGNYSTEDLETALGAKMTLASTSSYTYTWSRSDLTGKWAISSTGSFLSVLFDTGTNAATSARDVVGFGVNDYTGSTSYTGSTVSLHTEEGVIIDTISTEAIDSVAVLFDPIDGIKLSGEAVLTIEANPTANFTSPAVTQTLTIDEESAVATHFFSSSQSYRYWRLKIVDTKNPYLYVEVGNIVLGLAMALTQAPEIGFGFKYDDRSKLAVTPYGHQYADVYPTLKGFEFNYNVLQYADLELLMDSFERVGNIGTVVLAIDTSEELFDKDRFFIYGKYSGDFAPKHRVNQLFNLSLRILEAP